MLMPSTPTPMTVLFLAGHLPEPALLKLESPVGRVPHIDMFFSALGTKIFVLMNDRCALFHDIQTAALSIGPHAPDKMLCGFGITVPSLLTSSMHYHIGSWTSSTPFMSYGVGTH
ncbi:hypothetical protein PR202_ga28721 [Eleusine coracana subsp. coracana]|uniref:Uncharacterized protein n=1 Tax=Eleusine coracana subsp. coracana TaxID=191504 RepID=A0AAV5DJZ4_ELECO|nr:hypothetical protein PR202_ga28721 [Eleusine coracana subsp. coracana]